MLPATLITHNGDSGHSQAVTAPEEYVDPSERGLMRSTTRPDPLSRFDGQLFEWDHTANTQQFEDLMATRKEFDIPAFLRLVLHGYAPQFIAIMTSSPDSTDSTPCNRRGAGATWRRSRTPLQAQIVALSHQSG
jgi:hypothetical protein